VCLVVAIGFLLWSKPKPLWDDPELERLHRALVDASHEHGRKVKAGELTAENFTADFNENVMPAIRAWEEALEERMTK